MRTAHHGETGLKWGLLSTARINRRLIPAIRAAERAEVAAVASRSRERAEAYAAEWGMPRAHGSYESLLGDPDVDVIYISLPNSLHGEWAVRAAQAGKHVLCEKPFTVSVAECDRVIAAAESAGVVVVEAVMYLHHPLLAEVRRLIQEGAVGRVEFVRGFLCILLDRPDDVRWKPELGGGALWDVGSYPVSFIRWVAGEPDEVFGWQTLAESGVDETFVGLLRYRSDVLGTFACGFRSPWRAEAQVFGTEGTLTIRQPYIIDDESKILLSRGSEEREIGVREIDVYQCEVEALTAAVLDGAPLPVSLASSRGNVATMAALYESARRGLPQPVSPA
jgi:xylose dehydrogenase (NAD/NADP)